MSMDLTEWGKWARHNPNKLGYQSPMLIVMRGNVQQSSNSIRYNITDEEAQTVDMAVTKLGKVNTLQYRIVRLYYLYGYSYRRIAGKFYKEGLKMSKDSVQRQLRQAEKYIYDLIFGVVA